MKTLLLKLVGIVVAFASTMFAAKRWGKAKEQAREAKHALKDAQDVVQVKQDTSDKSDAELDRELSEYERPK